MSAFPTDAERQALEAIQFGSYQAADYARTALARLVAAREVAAWDEGFDAGHQSARAVNPEWPAQPSNPYREDRSDALGAGEDRG